MRIIKGWQKYFGLMFRTRYTEEVQFEFKEEVLVPIHTWFVFFPCLIIWKDKNNEVVEQRIVKPFQSNIKPSKPFKYLVEVPFTKERAEKHKKDIFGLARAFFGIIAWWCVYLNGGFGI